MPLPGMVDFYGDVIRKAARTSTTNPQGYAFEMTGTVGVSGTLSQYGEASISVTAAGVSDVFSALGFTPKILDIRSVDDNEVYYGYTNAVTATSGHKIFKDQPLIWDSAAGVPTLFLIRATAGTSVVKVQGAA